MRKRSDKLSRAAHVKRHTQGTSNEISFSVLDAAKNALEDGKPRPTDQARRFGRISLFTLPIGRKKPPSTPIKDQAQAIASSLAHPVLPKAKKLGGSAKAQELPAPAEPAAPPQQPEIQPAGEMAFESAPRSSGRTSRDEIAWRKSRRRRRRILAGIASAIIIVGMAGAGVWWLYNDNERYQYNMRQIEESRDALASTDDLLLQLDQALQDPMGGDAAEYLANRQQDVQQAMAVLEDAERSAASASAGLRETAERTAADNLMTTSSARQTMFESGWTVLEQAQTMRDPYEQLQDIWQDVLAADEDVRAAASEASAGQRSAIASSRELMEQAQSQMTRTRENLATFSQVNPDIEVSPLIEYLDKRIEALGYAIASDDALEQRNTQAAVESNDAYNAADEEAAELAALLPVDPGQPVLDAMEQRVADSVESYEAARAQASTSDAFLRDYFGSSER